MIEKGELLAATFFSHTFGDIAGAKIFPICIALSAFGAVCAMVFSAASLIQSASVSGYLPLSSVFKQVHPKTKTPVNALLLHWAIVCALLVLPPAGKAFDFLVSLVCYPVWIFYGFAVVGLLIMRKSHAHLPRPFKIWAPFCWVFIAVSVFLAVFPLVPPTEDPGYPYYLPAVLGLIFIIIGIPYKRLFVKETPESDNEFDEFKLEKFASAKEEEFDLLERH